MMHHVRELRTASPPRSNSWKVKLPLIPCQNQEVAVTVNTLHLHSVCILSSFTFSLYPQSCHDASLNGYVWMLSPQLNLFSTGFTDMP